MPRPRPTIVIMLPPACLTRLPRDGRLNNIGNVQMQVGQYADAVQSFKRASRLSASFSFAQTNLAMALYLDGQKQEALRTFRNVLRKYPYFDDAHAAFAAALWREGDFRTAEEEFFIRNEDARYRDVDWLRSYRRWAPPFVEGARALVEIRRSDPTGEQSG